jgi:hypothetical protein
MTRPAGEAACKVAIEHAGASVTRNASLTTLFKDAHPARPTEDHGDGEIAKSLTATVD